MKRILLALLLFASAGVAWGQPTSNLTINYQGRAQDQDGNAVTGARQVTLRIYDALTGGSPLFTESHPAVVFSDAGIFTVVIGGNSPAGIPATIDFSRPHWLGVSISGFNGGNELPRLRFHGSPRSAFANRADSSRSAGLAARATRADNADRADLADSSRIAGSADFATQAGHAETATTAEFAGSLEAPVTLTHEGDQPTLTVVNTLKGAPALNVDGELVVRGGINATGICGTTDHFRAGTDLGNTNVPEPGGFYRDNAPIAWGQVQADGSLLADFGIARVLNTPNNPGIYLVEFDNGVTVNSNNQPGFAVVVTPSMQPSVTAPMLVAGWEYAIDQATLLPRNDAVVVFIRSIDQGQNAKFSIAVFGRPESN